jgi:Domain of unknown function (DUF305)
MRLLLGFLVLGLITACGESSGGGGEEGSRASDIVFVTELMHRDAALLNLLDVALGRPLDPELTAATDQLRVDANARIEAAADQLEAWNEKVPRTVRDHSFEHSTDAHDIPSLDGMPTGDDLQRLGGVPPAGFEAAFVGLLRKALEASRELAGAYSADADQVSSLARDAQRSCASGLKVL